MKKQEENLTFLSGADAEYIAHLYGEFFSDSSKVDVSWQEFFGGLNDNEVELLKELGGASWTPEENCKLSRGFDKGLVDRKDHVDAENMTAEQTLCSMNILHQEDIKRATMDSVRALMLIRAYRARGHLIADLDPLGLRDEEYHAELDPVHFGFSAQDIDRKIYIGGSLGLEYASINEIVAALKETYCGSIGVEFLHLSNPEEKSWVQERIEAPHNKTSFTVNGKRAILQRIIAAEGFEKFLHKKYPGTKRFGVDGGEALIPCMEQIMKRGGQLGLEEIVIGMSHRGRLNVLANVMGKPFTTIFAEFQGHSSMPDDVFSSGDVKYHMGTSSDRDFDGNSIHLSLTANPSHLEFVNPIVIGKVYAKQAQRKDVESGSVLPLLLHGDAAFSGQGIVAETLMIAELLGYRVGGTIHIVINNQIGFTTMPKFGRSGPYSTDVAKVLAVPIFHVNGDDPEAVVHVARIATEFRQTFRRDVVIDMFCYRRFGHSEGDEPAFTQPLMYKKIAEQETTQSKYIKQLIDEKVVTQEDVDEMISAFDVELETSFKAMENFKSYDADYLGGAWDGLKVAGSGARRGKTSITEKEVQEIGKVLTSVPDGFAINKKLKRILDAKAKMFETGKGFDWGTAEALAFGSLIKDNFSVRFSGQDVGRGTFSHRHAVWYDQENEERYFPLQHICSDNSMFEIRNSPLSEMAVLGFEYGMSLADPKTLVLWEAQFGDFANGAQVMIDQFISSGESKWLRMSGLVMLLPHGFEGQGPDHSSARLERFLQMSADDNWQVCNCTTPASYFHVLRRQMLRDFRKPLIIMSPKSLLRHKLAISSIEDFTEGTSFHRFLWDDDYKDIVSAGKIKRVVLCSGKVYYDLLSARRERKIDDVYLLRLEQLYPFPSSEIAEELSQFENADIIWCQEEPRNQGAWTFIEPLIEGMLVSINHKVARPRFVGRVAASAPATGLMSRHQAEQDKLVDEALTFS
ncbi:MAG: 2-oxoglutarate dehydrogenase E1 component [Alphaproteobacteria bacterium]|nr:2-oxoglutarate dehydrogenase E1 component [Alphaproteobacteria bacterium]